MSVQLTAFRKFRSACRRVSSRVATRWIKLAGVRLGDGCRFIGFPIVSLRDGSSIRIGARALVISKADSTALGVNHPVILRTLATGAEIEIGDDVGMSGVTICAAARVQIGDGCLLGANSMIVDTDFHPVDDLDRRYRDVPVASPLDAVVIGRNVFIGANSIILKGASIGDDSVIGASSVVSGNVPPRTVVAGSPARPIRSLQLESSSAH